MKKISYILPVAFATLFYAHSCMGSNSGFRGDWTETFYLKDKTSFITHTPKNVSFNNQLTANGLNFKSASLNGMPMSGSGLSVKTDSTREEFVRDLIRSGLFEGR